MAPQSAPGISWEPFIIGAQKVDIEDALTRYRETIIRAALEDRTRAAVTRPEVALFLDRLEAVMPRRGMSSLIEHILNVCCQNVTRLRSETMFAGRAGYLYLLGMVSRRYQGRHMIEAEADALDAELFALIQSDAVKESDLIRGLVGFAIYLMARRSEMALEALQTLLRTLERRTGSPGDFDTRTGSASQTNLGISHGVPGILCIGADALCLGVETARGVLERTAAFVLTCRQHRAGSAFGYKQGEVTRSRVAWCYGDLSIALALAKSGRALNRQDLLDESRSILRSVARRSVETSGIVDASLCHGSLGAAHCFNWAYLLTGERSALTAAKRWMRFYIANDARRAAAHTGAYAFLEGIPGMGLVLLAAADKTEPRWDSILGLSPPAWAAT